MKRQQRRWLAWISATLLALPLSGVSATLGPLKASVDWPAYLGDAASSHYSRLDQIQAKNVGRLKVAWTYRSG